MTRVTGRIQLEAFPALSGRYPALADRIGYPIYYVLEINCSRAVGKCLLSPF